MHMKKKTISSLNQFGWELCEEARRLYYDKNKGLITISKTLALNMLDTGAAVQAGRDLRNYARNRSYN